MLEVHGNIIAPNVGCHGYDGSGVELADEVACRNSVEIRHDNIHQNQIILRSRVHLVDSF
jgi:hypothetical protein